MALFVSIIIPTLNRCDVLKNAIASAQKQSWPADQYEIIVVNNGSTDDTSQVVARMAMDSKTDVRLVYEPRLGLHHARHAGVRAAAGEILIFTDDDAAVSPEWVRAYAEGFAKYPAMIAAGGPVRPSWETQPPQWLLDYMGEAKMFCTLSLMEPYQEFRLSQSEVFFGVNMALRRSVFDWTGFHPELFGTRTVGDGEAGLNQDISRRGGLIGYIPTALVYHRIPAHRMTVDYIRRWAWHQGGVEMYVRWWNQKRSFTVLALELIRIACKYSPQWVKDLLVRDRSDRRSIDIQFQASLGWCKLTYVWWMLIDPQVQAVLDERDHRP